MKRILSLVLVIALLISIFVGHQIYAANAEGKGTNSGTENNMLKYLQSDNDELLIQRGNYGYMTFIGDFNSDAMSLYLMKMTDMLIGTGLKPDKQKYMEVLINIMAVSDLDNATDIREQHKMDNLKSFKDYAMDVVQMGENAVSVMAGTSSATSQLETKITTAIDGISVLKENTENWIEALSNLETIVGEYSEYDDFLELIEQNGDGELKEAAFELRSSLATIMEKKLDTYAEVSNENFKNYGEYFFSDAFFSALQQTKLVQSDENLQYFVNCGSEILSKVETLGESWDLGTMIGTLVGDAVVGGENLIDRVLEMTAIYDISVILQEKLIDTGKEFLDNYEKENQKNLINSYVSFSQYLTGCRVRGEYCLYSIVANDAGLLSWFQKQSAEEAKEWYEAKTEKIMGIQDNLQKIVQSTEDTENIDAFSGLPEKFIFTSGIGSWYTTVSINQDGTFSGDYSDTDMGLTGTDYPKGTTYKCNFTGKFSEVTKIDKYEYSMKIEYLHLEEEAGKESIVDGVKVITTDPYGFDDAQEFRLYLPGRKTADLPEEFLFWISNTTNSQTELSFYGLYNVSGKEGFSGMN